MDLRVLDDPADLAGEASSLLAGLLGSEGHHSLGLAGGSTPAATYRLLGGEPIDWSRIDLWLGDERWVPPDDDQSNARMCREQLQLTSSANPIHQIPYGEGVSPADSAEEYEKTLRDIVFSKTAAIPDIVLLGLGDDGHTASLFPDTDALEETERAYVANFVDKLGVWRLTATIPLLATANHIVFLISGASKSEAVRALIEPEADDHIPARLVMDRASNVSVLLDRAAASGIS